MLLAIFIQHRGNQHMQAEILLFEVLLASPFISDLLSTQNFVETYKMVEPL